MSLQASVAYRNAMLDLIETVVGTGAKIRIYTGAQPASVAAAATGALLAQFDLASDWIGPSVGGAKPLLDVPIESVGLAAGKAGHFRILRSDGAICDFQGSVVRAGAGPGDMVIDNDDIGQGEAVQILSFAFGAPMA